MQGIPVPSSAEPRILVSLATYNEATNIASLIGEIHKIVPAADVLVIDDNSPDGTGKIVDERGAKDNRIHALHRPGKNVVTTQADPPRRSTRRNARREQRFGSVDVADTDHDRLIHQECFHRRAAAARGPPQMRTIEHR